METRTFLYEFQNLHKNEACIILALGSSLKKFTKKYWDLLPSIGVNDINKYYTPIYQILSESLSENIWLSYNKDKTKMAMEKINTALATEANYVFSCSNDIFPNSVKIAVEYEDLRKVSIDRIIQLGKLFAFRKITTCALSLAHYMGFKYIGIIGWDESGERAVFPETNNINMPDVFMTVLNNYCDQISKFMKDNGIEVYNLSKVSKVKGFKYKSIQDYYSFVKSKGLSGKKIKRIKRTAKRKTELS